MSGASKEAAFVQGLLEAHGPAVENMFTLANLAKAGLDRRALAIVLDLIENGVDPESIAQVIQEIRLTSKR